MTVSAFTYTVPANGALAPLLEALRAWLLGNGWEVVDAVYGAGALTTFVVRGTAAPVPTDNPLVQLWATNATTLGVLTGTAWSAKTTFMANASSYYGEAVTVMSAAGATVVEASTDGGRFLALTAKGAARTANGVVVVGVFDRLVGDPDTYPYGVWKPTVPGALLVSSGHQGTPETWDVRTVLGLTAGLSAPSQSGQDVLFPLYVSAQTYGKLKGLFAGARLGPLTLMDGDLTEVVDGCAWRALKTGTQSAMVPWTTPKAVAPRKLATLPTLVNTCGALGANVFGPAFTAAAVNCRFTGVGEYTSGFGGVPAPGRMALRFAKPVLANAVRVVINKITPGTVRYQAGLAEVACYRNGTKLESIGGAASSTGSGTVGQAADDSLATVWWSNGGYNSATGEATSSRGYEYLDVLLCRAEDGVHQVIDKVVVDVPIYEANGWPYNSNNLYDFEIWYRVGDTWYGADLVNDDAADYVRVAAEGLARATASASLRVNQPVYATTAVYLQSQSLDTTGKTGLVSVGLPGACAPEDASLRVAVAVNNPSAWKRWDGNTQSWVACALTEGTPLAEFKALTESAWAQLFLPGSLHLAFAPKAGASGLPAVIGGPVTLGLV